MRIRSILLAHATILFRRPISGRCIVGSEAIVMAKLLAEARLTIKCVMPICASHHDGDMKHEYFRPARERVANMVFAIDSGAL